jgi:hypothetical protein
MHAMINQAVAAERTREMRTAAESERIARQARRAGHTGHTGRAGRVRWVLSQPRRLSAAIKI